MVWPGPSSRAMRIAPATLTPVEPPITSPSCGRGRTPAAPIPHPGSATRRRPARPSRLAVMRPWPMPSVIEEPSAFSSPVRVVVVERGAGHVGEPDAGSSGCAPSGTCRRRRACRRCRPRRRRRRPCRRSASQISGPVEFDMRLPVGDVVELVRPDRAAASRLAQAARPAARTPSRSCSGSCRGRPAPRSARRRRAAARASSPPTACRG